MSWVNLSDVYVTRDEYDELKDAWDSISQDYIVKQTTSGNWLIRKWNSGFAECYFTGDKKTFTTSSTSGNTYYAQMYTNLAFPITFTKEPRVVGSIQQSSGGSTYPTYGVISTTSIAQVYANRGKSAETTCHLTLYVTGTWK